MNYKLKTLRRQCSIKIHDSDPRVVVGTDWQSANLILEL